MIAINAPYSFVQFNNRFDTSLPIENDGDVKFQVVLSGTRSECNDLMTQNIYLGIVASNAVITDDASLTAALLVPVTTQFFAPFRVSETKVLLYWQHGFPGVSALPPGTCFKVAFKANGSFFTSNVFLFDTPTRFTSVLEYSCEENSNGFYYCFDDLPNRGRLPLYLAKPQYQDEESIYIRSGGEIDVLSSITKKEYTGKTAYLQDELHLNIKIALSSDSINIESHFYNGGIRKNGNYDIAWPDGLEDELGQAEFKVFATPFNVRNTNCAECGEEWIDDGNYPDGSYSEEFTVSDITSSSFKINTGFAPGVTWDLSLDGGATFIQLALTSENYIVSGLTTATTCQVVRLMHGLYGSNQTILPPTPVTTL